MRLARTAMRHASAHRARAVVERRVGDLHARQARHHGLVLVEELQRALARLGLVRRVGAVELAARRDGPHCRGNVMLVGAGADEAERPAVEPRALGHQPPDLHLAQRPRARRRALVSRRLAGISSKSCSMLLDADGREHRRDILAGVRDEGHQPPSSATSFSYSAALRNAPAAAPAAGPQAHQPALAVGIGIDRLRLRGERRIAGRRPRPRAGR